MQPPLRKRALVAVVLGVLAALGYHTAASAHGADAPVAVGYVVHVDGVSVAGVVVRAVEGGARLELRNDSGRTVVVLGLQGEEFLRVGPQGVAENRRSPTWLASRSVSGTAAGGDPGAAPDWHRVSGVPVVRWHDERARELPARAWSVPLLVDGTEPGLVRGTVTVAGSPRTAWWWAGALLVAAGVVLLRRHRPVLVVVAFAAGAAATGWVVACAELAASPADGLGVQVLARLWPLLTGAGVLGAGVLLVSRRPAADIVVAITGACLAVMVGFGDSAVFRFGSLAGPGWSRWAVAAALAGGLGLLGAGALRWYGTPNTTTTN